MGSTDLKDRVLNGQLRASAMHLFGVHPFMIGHVSLTNDGACLCDLKVTGVASPLKDSYFLLSSQCPVIDRLLQNILINGQDEEGKHAVGCLHGILTYKRHFTVDEAVGCRQVCQ